MPHPKPTDLDMTKHSDYFVWKDKRRHKTTHGGEQGTSRRPPTTQRSIDSGFDERTTCRRPERNPRPMGAIATKSLDED